jgi:hypothetical protein
LGKVQLGGTRHNPTQTTTVEQFVRHPSNPVGVTVQGFDVALFKLAKPLTINGSESGFRRELWPRTSAELAHRQLLCVGWGVTSDQFTAAAAEQSLSPAAFAAWKKKEQNPAGPEELRAVELPVLRVDLDLTVDGARVGDHVVVGRNDKDQIPMHGDSGCGWFLEDNGTWYLAAVDAGGPDPPVNEAFACSVAHDEVYNWVMDVVFGRPPRHDWERLADGLTSGPGICSWGTGRRDVFARSGSGHLWHKWFDPDEGGWSEGEDLGDDLAALASPAAASWEHGRIDVFYCDNGGGLHHQWLDAGWHGPEKLADGLASAPAVCSWGPGRLDVFARSGSGHLWHKWFDLDEGGWNEAEDLGVELAGAPAAASWEHGRIDVVVRADDGGIRHKWFEQGSWTG